jgi:hypothetical protein
MTSVSVAHLSSLISLFCGPSDETILEKKSYAVSTDRTILISGLEAGKTYVTRLVASDGIESETKSDPQMINTLAKGNRSFFY